MLDLYQRYLELRQSSARESAAKISAPLSTNASTSQHSLAPAKRLVTSFRAVLKAHYPSASDASLQEMVAEVVPLMEARQRAKWVAQAKANQEARLRTAFKGVDADGSCGVDVDEFLGAVADARAAARAANARAAAPRNKASRAAGSAVSAARAVAAAAAAAATEQDVDVEEQQVEEDELDEAELKRLFAAADTDGNGSLDIDEYATNPPFPARRVEPTLSPLGAVAIPS